MSNIWSLHIQIIFFRKMQRITTSKLSPSYFENDFLLCYKNVTASFFRVLDNLKEYAVRALVNAVDHLGTVAYKLTDLFEQQSSDVSTIELKIYCLNQVNVI